MLYILTLTALVALIAFLMIDRHETGPRADAEDEVWGELERRIEADRTKWRKK